MLAFLEFLATFTMSASFLPAVTWAPDRHLCPQIMAGCPPFGRPSIGGAKQQGPTSQLGALAIVVTSPSRAVSGHGVEAVEAIIGAVHPAASEALGLRKAVGVARLLRPCNAVLCLLRISSLLCKAASSLRKISMHHCVAASRISCGEHRGRFRGLRGWGQTLRAVCWTVRLRLHRRKGRQVARHAAEQRRLGRGISG